MWVFQLVFQLCCQRPENVIGSSTYSPRSGSLTVDLLLRRLGLYSPSHLLQGGRGMGLGFTVCTNISVYQMGHKTQIYGGGGVLVFSGHWKSTLVCHLTSKHISIFIFQKYGLILWGHLDQRLQGNWNTKPLAKGFMRETDCLRLLGLQLPLDFSSQANLLADPQFYFKKPCTREKSPLSNSRVGD